MPFRKADWKKRFWSKVHTHGGDMKACWEWMGTINSHGYGQFWLDYKILMASRVAYELLVGPIPEGLTLDHLCRNRKCVNPYHLEPVTQKVNNARGSHSNGRYYKPTNKQG